MTPEDYGYEITVAILLGGAAITFALLGVMTKLSDIRKILERWDEDEQN